MLMITLSLPFRFFFFHAPLMRHDAAARAALRGAQSRAVYAFRCCVHAARHDMLRHARAVRRYARCGCQHHAQRAVRACLRAAAYARMRS